MGRRDTSAALFFDPSLKSIVSNCETAESSGMMVSAEFIVIDFLVRLFDSDADYAIMDRILPDVRVSGVEELDIHGRDDFLRFQRMIAAQITDVTIEPRIVLTDAPWVSIISTIEFVDRATWITVRDRIQTTMRLDGARIAEIVAFIDFLSIFERLGRLPPRTLDRCLTGEVLRAR